MSDTKDDDQALRAAHGVHVQPDPVHNDHPSAHDLLIAEVGRRKAFGLAKYGTTLQAFNGRDPLKDALDEAIDLCVYLVTAIEERDAKPETWDRIEDVPEGVTVTDKDGCIWPSKVSATRAGMAYINMFAPFTRADS